MHIKIVGMEIPRKANYRISTNNGYIVQKKRPY